MSEFSFAVAVENPEINLFFWALVLNRIELAKIFLRIGKVNGYLFVKIFHKSATISIVLK